MGYSLGCSPFFIMFTRMFTKCGQNAVTPIYTHDAAIENFRKAAGIYQYKGIL